MYTSDELRLYRLHGVDLQCGLFRTGLFFFFSTGSVENGFNRNRSIRFHLLINCIIQSLLKRGFNLKRIRSNRLVKPSKDYFARLWTRKSQWKFHIPKKSNPAKWQKPKWPNSSHRPVRNFFKTDIPCIMYVMDQIYSLRSNSRNKIRLKSLTQFIWY